MTAAWETIRAGEVPNRLAPQMRRALDALAGGVAGRKAPQPARRRSRSPAGASIYSSAISR